MKITIRDLRLPVSLGVHDWEKDTLREVVVNVECIMDGSAAVVSDSIEDTADYTAIESMLLELFASQHWNLIETLARRSADLLCSALPQLQYVEVTIDKPGALRFAASVAVTATAGSL